MHASTTAANIQRTSDGLGRQRRIQSVCFQWGPPDKTNYDDGNNHDGHNQWRPGRDAETYVESASLRSGEYFSNGLFTVTKAPHGLRYWLSIAVVIDRLSFPCMSAIEGLFDNWFVTRAAVVSVCNYCFCDGLFSSCCCICMQLWPLRWIVQLHRSFWRGNTICVPLSNNVAERNL